MIVFHLFLQTFLFYLFWQIQIVVYQDGFDELHFNSLTVFNN